MIDLTEDQVALLDRIRHAGAGGYALRQGEVGNACRMGSAGFCEVRANRAVITSKGRAFAHRAAA